MNMVSISKCSMSTCAYNMDGACHTLAITVGPHAECNTYMSMPAAEVAFPKSKAE